jgi:hypothetical protein
VGSPSRSGAEITTAELSPELADGFANEHESSVGWAWGIWVVVVVFGAVAVWRSLEVGIGFRDPHGEILRSRIALTGGISIALSAVDASVRAGRPWAAHRVFKMWRARWTLRRLALSLSALLAYQLVYFGYHNLKSWVVFLPNRDAMMVRLDRWLFFGHSPAVLLHDLLGQHLAAYVLMFIYESFSTMMDIGFVGAVVCANRVRDGYVFIASAMWVWILGAGSYYLIPTLGPFHGAPADFAGLPHTLVQNTQTTYMAQRAFLLAHPHVPTAYAQVSAFASLHCGVSCLLLLMARYYGLRRLSWFLTVWLVGVVTATIYLGWHFAIDDVAGIAIAFIGVFIGTRMIYPHGDHRPDLWRFSGTPRSADEI